MIRRFFALLALIGLTLIGTPAVVSATYDPIEGVNCSVAVNAAACAENTSGDKDPIAGHNGVLLKIVNIISIIAGAAAVILIVVSGLRFVIANGDGNAVSGAKNTLVNAVIGLVVIILARALITYVINKV